MSLLSKGRPIPENLADELISVGTKNGGPEGPPINEDGAINGMAGISEQEDRLYSRDRPNSVACLGRGNPDSEGRCMPA